ncbi:disulfide bond formation protein DsbA [Rhizobium sp. Leaf384]|uniref:DsbA family oxidoreductase n=1 Tax=unclassified Rhizobium TaxID=2613769 RepID=UPI00071480A5|nr:MULTISPECIES: DsbA family oxidoreductase [unclassified Rhizobium]KQS79566.1 disulfide bond formation protein DsbA [Rhizobium sp. Leaf384]KQS82980.1 disulfide bond formation protein DsbA [Rhizobium sp. Leaf383]
MEHVTVDVVSDVVCPWCYLGKARLDKAIAELASEILVTVNWRPYQLNPDLPPEGVDHKAHLAAKLGGHEAVARAHQTLTALGHADGVVFDFDAVTVSPNTLDAHRLIRWAQAEGADVQANVVSGLFRANFAEGRNVGDRETLIDIAEAGGLDRAVVTALFASDADSADVKTEIDMARDMGVTGVPCFIIESKYAVMGAQSVEVLTSALRDIAEMKNQANIN